MRKNPARAELLDLLHHWRNERYVHRVATNVDRHLFSSCFTQVEIEGMENARRSARKPANGWCSWPTIRASTTG